MCGCSRACEKIVLQPREPDEFPHGAKHICDIVRFMFVCKTLSDMATLLDRIRESPHVKVVRFKDRIKNPSGGWRDAMINFCVTKPDCPRHICEVQIVHRKMALCRHKDGQGGHDEYAQERNAREILEHLGLPQPEEEADTSPQQAEMVSAREDAEAAKAAVAKAEAARAKAEADARSVRAGAGAVITWSHHTGNGFVMQWVVRLLTKSHRNKSKVEPSAIAAETAPAPVASESSRPESSASKYHYAGERW